MNFKSLNKFDRPLQLNAVVQIRKSGSDYGFYLDIIMNSEKICCQLRTGIKSLKMIKYLTFFLNFFKSLMKNSKDPDPDP